MCWICDAYGDGGLWYKNPRNYARRMYRRRQPGTAPAEEYSRAYRGTPVTADPIATRNDEPEKLPALVEQYWANITKARPMQVIPLEDAFEVVDLASPVAAMSCECRLWTRGLVERNKDQYSCLGLGVGMLKWERWPERYKGGVHFMSPDEAKEWLTKWNKKGMVQLLMTYGAPYVGGLCNCDYPDCVAIRMRLDLGVGLLKSHYVAKLDYDLCDGCGLCIGRCQFGALKLEVTTMKANIDQFRCFGCGLCRDGCGPEAITLVERASVPALREAW